MLTKFWRDEKGATAVEYALIATISSITIIAGLSLMNESLLDIYTKIVGAFMGAFD